MKLPILTLVSVYPVKPVCPVTPVEPVKPVALLKCNFKISESYTYEAAVTQKVHKCIWSTSTYHKVTLSFARVLVRSNLHQMSILVITLIVACEMFLSGSLHLLFPETCGDYSTKI